MIQHTMRTFATSVLVGAICLTGGTAWAHFIWLAPEGGTVQVHFGEEASPDDPERLRYVEGMQAWQLRKGGELVPLKLERTDEALTAGLPDGTLDDGLLIGLHDLGVMNRGDAVFRLKYYAKAGPPAGASVWKEIDCSKQLALDVVPEVTDGGVLVRVRFHGKPAAGAQIVASGPGVAEFEGETDAKGTLKIDVVEAGRFSIRARHIEKQAGEHEGKKYPEVRHYTTLTLDLTSTKSATARLEPLEQPVTSFGGAVLDDAVYVYGGHTGGAHSYSNDEQDRFVRRLDLRTGKWSTLAEGPRLQGLALVAHGDKLYRIGGFVAKNEEGEEHDLWSQKGVAAFDPQTNSWTEMPPLPEPRSSFDAAVLGESIYVIGGWQMSGADETVWHETAWAMDLSSTKPQWRELPKPPFKRRALAVAAHNGKIYVIGGMQEEGGPTTRTDVFDPATGQWSEGPSLVAPQPEPDAEGGEGQSGRGRSGGGMTGFGSSAFATGGKLYVSTIDGSLQRLADDGSSWSVVSKTPTARFFHRMLPIDDGHFVMVGGANMGVGKFEEVEIIDAESAPLQ